MLTIEVPREFRLAVDDGPAKHGLQAIRDKEIPFSSNNDPSPQGRGGGHRPRLRQTKISRELFLQIWSKIGGRRAGSRFDTHLRRYANPGAGG